MKRFCILLFFLFLPSLLLAAGWKRYTLLPATSWRTHYYVYRASRPGPVILLLAPHADERSAGFFLYRLIRKYKTNRGTLIVFPAPSTPAWRRYKRYVIEDLNRQFGVDSSNNNTPVDIVASAVRNCFRKYKIALVLNLHEGWSRFRVSWQDFGQSLVIDDPKLVPLCKRVLKRVNRRVAKVNRFWLAYKPMGTTLTYFSFDRGVPAIGVEVSQLIRPMRRKILYQKIVIQAFLREMKIRLLKR